MTMSSTPLKAVSLDSPSQRCLLNISEDFFFPCFGLYGVIDCGWVLCSLFYCVL